MKFTYKKRSFYIHKQLANALDSMVYNLPKDWDFFIVITGDRMVRVGKSVLAQIICAYLAYRINKYISEEVSYSLDDIYFDHEVMLNEAEKKPRFSLDHYDEAREGLAAIKAMTSVSKGIVDFFNECGQLNHIFVVVIPDFFSLHEEIAVARSEVLINVYRREEKKMVDMYKEGTKIPVVKFTRGYFEFFSRDKKSQLYDAFKKTRRKSYWGAKADFLGDFYNQYAVDEEKYREKKMVALARLKDRAKDAKKSKSDIFRDREIRRLRGKGLSCVKISNYLAEKYDFSISYNAIHQILYKKDKKMANV